MTDKQLTFIVLLTHGRWGEALIESAESIIGFIPNICSFSLMPSQGIDDYFNQIVEKFEQLKDCEVLIMTDIFIGSTTRTAVLASINNNFMAISGLSLEMLLAAEELRRKHQGEELVQVIMNHVQHATCNIRERFCNLTEKAR